MAAQRPVTARRSLGVVGRELWRSIARQWFDDKLTPDARELRLLADACAEADMLARLENALAAEVKAGKLIVKGSQGQPVVNSVVASVGWPGGGLMARPWQSRHGLRELLVAECDHFAETFRARGLELTDLRAALVAGSAVVVSAHFLFDALYHAGDPARQQSTYRNVQDQPFLLTADDQLEADPYRADCGRLRALGLIE